MMMRTLSSCRSILALVAWLAAGTASYSQSASPSAPAATAAAKSEARFGNVLYTTPDATVWHRAEEGGRLVFSTALPPPDFCTITIFPGEKLEGDLKTHFKATIEAELKREGVIKVDSANPIQEKKSGDETYLMELTLQAETTGFHTVHTFVAFHWGDRFDLIGFQTSGLESYKAHKPELQSLLQSVRLANTLTDDAGGAAGNVAVVERPTVTKPIAPTDKPIVPSAPARAIHLPPLKPRPGYIIGRAVFADGRPIPSFTVSAGSLIGGAGEAKGVNGAYAVRVVNPDLVVFNVLGFANLSYNGKTYVIQMHPLDGISDRDERGRFTGYAKTGVVRDFVFHLSGVFPGYDANASPNDPDGSEYTQSIFEGFPMYLEAQFDPRAYVTLQLTLTPVGPLADGTQIAPIRRTLTKVGYGNAYGVDDVPLGVYMTTVSQVDANGGLKPAHVQLKNIGTPQDSVRIEFPADAKTNVFARPRLQVTP